MISQGALQTTRKILAIQLILTLIVAAVSLIFVDLRAAWSALIGGGINGLATAFFAQRVFAVGPGATAKHMARAFYIGEVVKILLTGVLFTAVVLWLDVAFLPLFLAYVVTMLAFWLALLVAF